MYHLYFLNTMVSQVQPEEEAKESFRKKQSIILTCPRDIRRVTPCRATRDRHQGGEKAEDRNEGKV